MAALLARPAQLYRALATAEMVTWVLLLLGMLGKYALGLGTLPVRIGGGLHGFVFLAYCLVTVLVGLDQRWALRDVALGLASAVAPFMTLPFERRVERKGLLSDEWRLRTEAPQGMLERLVAWAVGQPLAAFAAAMVGLFAVFGGLLWLGPPWEWFR